jgi:hypothetical protein
MFQQRFCHVLAYRYDVSSSTWPPFDPEREHRRSDIVDISADCLPQLRPSVLVRTGIILYRRSGSACCPVVELRQLVVSFFQRWFAESFMALQNFGPGLSNSYQAFSSSPTTAVLVHNLFPSFNCRSISLFWMISTSS